MANNRSDDSPDLIVSFFEGIKNTVTRERLSPNQLESARNIDLSDAGQARRRRGFHKVVEGDFHSLYTAPSGAVFVVRDGQLCELRPDLTTQILGAGGGSPLSYVDVGGTVYFTSREVSGKILPNRTILNWGQIGGDGTWLSPVVNPTETLGPVAGKTLRAPPLARWLAHMAGRIYLADGSVLWATELFMYDYVDATRTFMQFESTITGLGYSADGLYVGTETGVWFLRGALGQMERTLVVNTGCIAGSMAEAPGDFMLVAGEPALQYRNAVLFMTEDGLIAGFNNGFCRNLTANETIFPHAKSAVPMFRSQDGINQYVAVLDSGGTPNARANIGDYVDAEIRRWQG